MQCLYITFATMNKLREDYIIPLMIISI